ncbi:hypothetical protein PRBEI_2001737300 [Prionailurus iriomotensis]
MLWFNNHREKDTGKLEARLQKILTQANTQHSDPDSEPICRLKGLL